MSQTKDYCLNHPSIAYYSGWDGIEIKGIEYGIEDYVYAVSGAWCSNKGYHRVKIQYTRCDKPYFVVGGHRIPLDECIRM